MSSAPSRMSAPAPRQAPLQRLASAEAAPGARPTIAALTGRGGAGERAMPVALETAPPVLEAHAPIQAVWPFTAAAPVVDPHALPANIAAQIAAHRQTLANAGAPLRGDADWYRQQQTAMHATEATVTAWLRDHGAQATEAQRQTMAGHLHDLEDHHTDLVGVQLQHNHPLWMPAGATKGHRRRARQTWASLRGNTGNLTVHGTTPGAHNALLADFAKLLQQPHGLSMLRELNSTDQGTSPVARPVQVSDDWSGPFAAANNREHMPGSWAVTHIDDDNSNRNPNGSGSYVQAVRGARHEATGTVGDTGVPMPHYVSLGHELGHALRNRRGLNQQAIPENSPIPRIERRLWTNQEEYENITQQENVIRGQHGLPLRAYHKPPLQVRVGRGYAALTERARGLQDHMTLPAWANPLADDQDQVGMRPNGTREFNPTDHTTYGNATAYFARANQHLDSLERWHRLRQAGQAVWNRVPDRWAGPRAVGALAQGVWNRLPALPRLPGWGGG